jgi:UDP-N-acetylmuramate--alanine ligase
VHRGELLGEICRLRRCIAIAGTHGKTTTAAMLVHALAAASVRASYAVGAILLDTGLNGDWTGSDLFIVETDESDGSHLAIEPEIAILTNADHDHVKRYPDIDAVRATFRQFLDGGPQTVIWDRPELLALSSRAARPFDATDVRADGSGTTFTWRGRPVRMNALGEHNAHNAAAALEACFLLGVDLDRAVASLACFGGTSRQLELRGRTATGARIYDDYAHHPTAVDATLQALGVLEARRLIAVLQPWGLPRVAALWREFGSSLDRADEAVVVDTVVGSSNREDFPGVGSELIVRAAQASRPGRPVHNIPRLEEAQGYLLDILGAGDVCVTLGCGDVDQLAAALVTGASSHAKQPLTA